MAVKIGQFMTGTDVVTTEIPVTGVGFEPQCVVLWPSGTAALGNSSRDNTVTGMGVAIADDERMSISSFDDFNAGSMLCARTMQNAGCVVILANNTTLDGVLDFVSFDSDGFTLVVDNQFGTSYAINYMAFTGVDNVKLLEYNDVLSGVGDEAFAGVGFQPDLVFFFSNWMASPTIANHAQFCTGVGTADKSCVTSFRSRTGVGAAQTWRTQNGEECLARIDNTSDVVDIRASLKTMDADGFTLDVLETDGSDQDFMCLCIKAEDVFVGEFLTETDTVTPIPVTGLGFEPQAAMIVSHTGVENAQNAGQVTTAISIGGFSATDEIALHATRSQDAQGASDAVSKASVDSIYLQIDNSENISAEMGLQSIDADGFTGIMTDADAANNWCWFWALRGLDYFLQDRIIAKRVRRDRMPSVYVSETEDLGPP